MKNIKAFSISTIIATIVITLSAIIEELSVSFKNSLNALTGYSWITIIKPKKTINIQIA